MNDRPAQQIERILITEEQLAARVADCAYELARLFQDEQPLFVGVLTGAFIFMADLVRAMPMQVDVEFMAVSSYGLATETSGVVRIIKDLDRPIEGRNVLIVEDIIDSGLTLAYLIDVLQRRNPRSLRVAAMLRKSKADAINVPVDFVGFEIPDEFVVGYGLDAGRQYRNLPYVAVVKT
jgi:hypoxanthine phosphoribosyltransferase